MCCNSARLKAHTSLRCEEYDATIADAKHCITLLGHDNFNICALLSAAALEAKRMPEALEWSTRTLELAPHHAVALRTRGKCLSIMGRYAEAYVDFKRAFVLTDHSDGYVAMIHKRIEPPHTIRIVSTNAQVQHHCTSAHSLCR